jgi:hypothetical protein
VRANPELDLEKLGVLGDLALFRRRSRSPGAGAPGALRGNTDTVRVKFRRRNRAEQCQQCFGLALTGFSFMLEIAPNPRTCTLNAMTARRSSGWRLQDFKVIKDSTNKGFNKKELRKIVKIIEQNQDGLMESWDEYFNE